MEQIKQLLIAVLQKMNLWEQNAKSIDELPDAPNVIPLAKIHISDNGTSKALELQKLIDASLSSAVNQITSIGEITVAGNDVTVPIATWKIANIGYSTIAPTVINVPFSATGTTRIDVFVANTSNQIVKISGNDTTGIAIRPNLPLNTVVVTEINVSEDALTPVPFPLTSDEIGAIQNANAPSASNPFATLDDIVAGGVSQLVDLTDVEIVSLADGQVLVWVEANGKWKNQDAPIGGTTPTLQEVLNNNHSLANGNNFQGTDAGSLNTGENNNGFGSFALENNSGSLNNGLGYNALRNNQGSNSNGFGDNVLNGNAGENVNAFGSYAGVDNTYSDVNLFGTNTSADEDGQLVFAKNASIFARLSTSLLTEIRKFILPDQDCTLASEQYVDAEISSAVAGLLDDRGNHDASSNAFPSSGGSGTAGAILKGDLWTISVAGTLGGVSVTVGDVIRAKVDAPGSTSSNWVITENNIGYVPENNANKSNDLADAASTTKFPVWSIIATYITNALASFKTSNFLDFTSSGQTQLDEKQDKAKLITANYIALNNDNLIINATCTITDVASPSNGTNFTCTIVNGTVTIGGVAYTDIGRKIVRIYNSGAWTTYTEGQLTNTFTDWSPTYGGFLTPPSGGVNRYCVMDKLCNFYIAPTVNGTSNATTFTVTLPFNAKNLQVLNVGFTVDNGGSVLSGGHALTTAGSNVLTISRASGAWTGINGKRAVITGWYEIQ